MLTLQTEERTQVKGEPPARTGSCIRGWLSDGFSCLIPILCRDEDNQIVGCLGEGATRGQQAPHRLLTELSWLQVAAPSPSIWEFPGTQ